MHQILYVGDIHGRLDKLLNIINIANKSNSTIVQVGDFGTFWPSNNATDRFLKTGITEKWNTSDLDKWISKRANRDWKTEIISVGGNHDNWNVIYDLWNEQNNSDKIELVPNSGVFMAARGSTLEINGIKHLFLGGAESTDKHHRIDNLTWWDREQPNQNEFELFFKNLEEYKPDVVVTHDAPSRVPLFRVNRDKSITPNTLEKCLFLSSHKPKHWYFGHHHILESWDIDGIQFHCCGLHGQYHIGI